MRLWLLSNGRGEDRAAALLGVELARRRSGLELCAAPLVTAGDEFSARGLAVCVSGTAPPSGGFPAATLATIARDVPSIPRYLEYVRRLRRLVKPGDEFVAAGDTFLTGLGRHGFRRAGVHVSLAKSVHAQRHFRVEYRLLRRWARLVFARDEATAEDLRRHGVRAMFVGNPLIDGLAAPAAAEVAGAARACVEGNAPRVLMLPGSRREAPANLVRLLDVAQRVREASAWACAWPGAIPIDAAMLVAEAAGWHASQSARLKPCPPEAVGQGFDPASLGGPVGRGFGPATRHLLFGDRSVVLAAGRFESMLASADLVVGLAGTANEQAAAAGKPVVSFVGCGPQTTAARMREQERLLGGAARFVPGGDVEAVAAVVSELLRAPKERRRMGRLGVERLGPPGGASRIAQMLIDELQL